MKNLIYHSAPKGVRSREELKELQKNIGVAPDGVWSAASEAAYEKYLEKFREPMTAAYQVEGYYAPGMVRNQKDVKMMQELLGNVAVDGVWGPETDSAYWQRIALEEARDSGSVPEVSATLASRISAAIANTKPAPENGMLFPAKAASGLSGSRSSGYTDKPPMTQSSPNSGTGLAGRIAQGTMPNNVDMGAVSGASNNKPASEESLPFFATLDAVDQYYNPQIDDLLKKYLSLRADAGLRGKPKGIGETDDIREALLDYERLMEQRDMAYTGVKNRQGEGAPYNPRHKPQKKRSRPTGTSEPTLTEQFLESETPLQDFIDYIFEYSDDNYRLRKDLVDEFYNVFIPTYAEVLGEKTNYVLPELTSHPYKKRKIVVVDKNNDPWEVLTFDNPDHNEILDMYLAIENGETPLISSDVPASYRPYFERLSYVRDDFAFTPYYKDMFGYHVDVYKNKEYLRTFNLGQDFPSNVSISIWKPSVEDLIGDIFKLYYEIGRDMLISKGAVSLASNAIAGFTGYTLTESDKFWLDQILDIPGIDDTIIQGIANFIELHGDETLTDALEYIMQDPQYYFYLDKSYIIQVNFMDEKGSVIKRSEPFFDD